MPFPIFDDPCTTLCVFWVMVGLLIYGGGTIIVVVGSFFLCIFDSFHKKKTPK